MSDDIQIVRVQSEQWLQERGADFFRDLHTSSGLNRLGYVNSLEELFKNMWVAVTNLEGVVLLALRRTRRGLLKPVGYLLGDAGDRDPLTAEPAEVDYLDTHLSYRFQGVGSRLMHAYREIVRYSNSYHITLSAIPSAVRFYLKLGLKAVSVGAMSGATEMQWNLPQGRKRKPAAGDYSRVVMPRIRRPRLAWPAPRNYEQLLT